MRPLALFVLVCCVGCGEGVRDYMPLREGAKWEYVVRLDGEDASESLSVVGRAPVGSVEGWRLRSEMGDSRLAWDGDDLVASELAGVMYSPPVPLLTETRRDWRGVVTTPTTKLASSATVTRSNEKLDVGGRSYDTIKTVLTLKSGDETVQLTTWFFPGMGILRQEQRRGPALTRDRLIEFVEGP